MQKKHGRIQNQDLIKVITDLVKHYQKIQNTTFAYVQLLWMYIGKSQRLE